MHVHVLCASMFAVTSVWLNTPDYGFNMFVHTVSLPCCTLCPALSPIEGGGMQSWGGASCAGVWEEQSGTWTADCRLGQHTADVPGQHDAHLPMHYLHKSIAYFTIVTTQIVTCYTSNSTVLYTLLNTGIHTYVRTYRWKSYSTNILHAAYCTNVLYVGGEPEDCRPKGQRNGINAGEGAYCTLCLCETQCMPCTFGLCAEVCMHHITYVLYVCYTTVKKCVGF